MSDINTTNTTNAVNVTTKSNFFTSYQNSYLSACTAGIVLGVAGFLYLSVFNFTLTYPIFAPFLKILAAVCFSYGLLEIIHNGRYLYTGMIGKANIANSTDWTHLIIILVGNIIFLTIAGIFTVIAVPDLRIIADSLIATKMIAPWYQVLAKSIGCGIFMYLAVNGCNDLITVMSVSGFILCGFEHCLANWYYFSVCSSLTFAMVGFTILCIIGNTIGANIIRLIEGKLNLTFTKKMNVCLNWIGAKIKGLTGSIKTKS